MKRDSQKKGVQFGNPETIRENQAIRANLRIDPHESGHPSSCGCQAPTLRIPHLGPAECDASLWIRFS